MPDINFEEFNDLRMHSGQVIVHYHCVVGRRFMRLYEFVGPPRQSCYVVVKAELNNVHPFKSTYYQHSVLQDEEILKDEGTTFVKFLHGDAEWIKDYFISELFDVER